MGEDAHPAAMFFMRRLIASELESPREYRQIVGPKNGNPIPSLNSRDEVSVLTVKLQTTFVYGENIAYGSGAMLDA